MYTSPRTLNGNCLTKHKYGADISVSVHQSNKPNLILILISDSSSKFCLTREIQYLHTGRPQHDAITPFDNFSIHLWNCKIYKSMDWLRMVTACGRLGLLHKFHQ